MRHQENDVIFMKWMLNLIRLEALELYYYERPKMWSIITKHAWQTIYLYYCIKKYFTFNVSNFRRFLDISSASFLFI